MIAEVYRINQDALPDSFDTMTDSEALEEMLDIGYLYDMTHFAVVDEKHLPQIAEWSTAALDHGCDSAWYEACHNFGLLVMERAERVIEIGATTEIVN